MNKKVPDITESIEELKSLMGQSTQVQPKTKDFLCCIFCEVDTPKIVNRSQSC